MTEKLATIAALAGIAGFCACWAGGIVCWLGMLLAMRPLAKRLKVMKATDPAKWQALHSWDGIQFGRWTATPAMWRWLRRDGPDDTADLRACKTRFRRCVKGFLACWIAGAVLWGAIAVLAFATRAGG